MIVNFNQLSHIDMAKNPQSKILVVDDVSINVMLLKRILEKANYNVCTAENGNVAIEKMIKEDISLVLLDIRMPHLDGFGVLEKKNEVETIKNIPVIMVSAFSEQEAINESLKKGAKAYLTKPVNRKDLMIEMKRILN